MGNSISSSGGGMGNGVTNRPSDVRYPFTANVDVLDDGHYLAMYPGLTIEQINNICESMDGVPSITDLTLIIGSARSTKKRINQKYIIKNVRYINRPVVVAVPQNPMPENTTINTTTTTTTTTPPETEKVPEVKNPYGITIDEQWYMIITTDDLFEKADDQTIEIKRSINTGYLSYIRIGTKNSNAIDGYFDAYIEDGFKTMKDSSNPLNPIRNRKIFLEIGATPSINFVFNTLQSNYSQRYHYVTVCKIEKLKDVINHIETVRNNANIMGIYYYNKNDLIIHDAVNKYALSDTAFIVKDKDYNLFTVNHENPNQSSNTVVFNGRVISIVENLKADLCVKSRSNSLYLRPKSLQMGYEVRIRIFKGVVSDNTTQIFRANQTISLNRNDFQLYIGYLNPDTEIDIIGTLLNATFLPTQKFIYYIDATDNDIFTDTTLPPELIKYFVSKQECYITNIKNIEVGGNISDKYSLTFSKTSNSVEEYDIINTSSKSLNIKTLRRNEIKSKQSMLSSHAGDMKSMGAYVPDSQLIIPAQYTDDTKLVIICAMDVTNTAVWNTAKLLRVHYLYKNWVLFFSMLKGQTLTSCNDYISKKYPNNMYILHHADINFELRDQSDSEIIFKEKTLQQDVFVLSQNYIINTTRSAIVGAATVYPGNVVTTVVNYQQYTYNITKNMSIIDYQLSETQINSKDMFIGGIPNTITIYSNLQKFKSPIIDQNYITSNWGMAVDYLPSIKNSYMFNSYVGVFRKFIITGSNRSITKYMCIMRVRREWLQKLSFDYKQDFVTIEGDNTDYILFCFMGGDTRYIYNPATKTFSLPKYQSIVFDSDKAKSETPSPEGTIYFEDQLTAKIKPRDEPQYMNIPFILSSRPTQRVGVTYELGDQICLMLTEYNTTLASYTLVGSISQADIALSRQTYARLDDWRTFIDLFYTIITETTTNGRAHALVFLRNVIVENLNVEIPSLLTSMNALLKDSSISKLSESYQIIHDRVNHIYILTNVNVAISDNSSLYTYRGIRISIRSRLLPNTTIVYKNDLLLNLLRDKLEYDENNSIFTNVNFSLRDQTQEVGSYQQVDRISKLYTGIKVDTDNKFWKSIRAFAYIPDIDRVEYENLKDMMSFLQEDLDGLFLLSLVSYDVTNDDPLINKNVFIIRANSNTPITILEQNEYYHITIKDPIHDSSYMKFLVWKNTSTVSPVRDDIKDVDFIINRTLGDNYDGVVKLYTNERIGMANNFFKFTFPSTTLNSFQDFSSFCTKQNKYILFARPIPKKNLNIYPEGYIALAEFRLTDHSIPLDFSELVNFMVQWRTSSKGKQRVVIIHNLTHNPITKPSKNYSITIDKITYDTSEFTFTTNPNVIIYPRVEMDNVKGMYKLVDNVYFNPDENKNNINYPNDVVYNTPEPDSTEIKVKIGSATGRKKLQQTVLSHLNWRVMVRNVIEVKN